MKIQLYKRGGLSWGRQRTALLQWKNAFISHVASLEGDNVLIFYYLCASEIWLNKTYKRVAFHWRCLIREDLLNCRIDSTPSVHSDHSMALYKVFFIVSGGIGLWLWCLMPLSTIFQLYPGRSVLLLEETGVPGENHLSQVTDKHYHIILYWVHLAWAVFELTTLNGDRHWLHR